MNLDISVVIVNWNSKEYLLQCITSVFAQTKKFNTEIIVVDNNSTDNSLVLVQEVYKDIIIIKNEQNLGFAKANNIGINNSKGNYLCLINPDVIVGENCIEIMLNYLSCHSEIGILGPQIIGLDGQIQNSCMGFPSLWNSFCSAVALDRLFPRIKIFNTFMMSYWPHNETKEVDVIKGCFWMIEKKKLNEVGLLDTNFFMYAEDMDWCRRFRLKNFKVVFLPEAKAIHFGHICSSNAPIRFFIEMKRANLQYWNKYNHSLIRRVAFSLIYFIHHLIRYVINFTKCHFIKKNNIETKYKTKRSYLFLKWYLKNYNNLENPVNSEFFE